MSGPLPLFARETTRKLEGLETQRTDLLTRMSHLGPMSHKRVIMQDRLSRLTTDTLRLENKLSRQEPELSGPNTEKYEGDHG